MNLSSVIVPLFVPGDRPERFEKAAVSGADAIITDLEDAVPAPSKTEAHTAFRIDFTSLPVEAGRDVDRRGIGQSHNWAHPWNRDQPAANLVIPDARTLR